MKKKLQYNEVGAPDFKIKKLSVKARNKLTLFDLPSHRRAKEAIEFGLNVDEHEFNIYVLGSNRSGRLRSTVGFVKEYLSKKPPVNQWVYLNNFAEPESPLPFHFPPGDAVVFGRDLLSAVERFALRLSKLFNSDSFLVKLNKESRDLEKDLQEDIEALNKYANAHHIELVHTDAGTIQPVLIERSAKNPITEEDKDAWYKVTDRLLKISSIAEDKIDSITDRVSLTKASEAAKLLKPIINRLKEKYVAIHKLDKWIDGLERDLLNNADQFTSKKVDEYNEASKIYDRYRTNMMVDANSVDHPPLVIEPNPTYENLFGTIKYKATPNGYVTDFTMISPGSLHKANGGVLVVRADDLVQNPESWKCLKDALRDRVIRIEEVHRANMLPVLEAPKPVPIPMNLKIIIIGAPLWFYMYFYQDKDFLTFFKIKADIDQNLHVDSKSLEIYKGLLEMFASEKAGIEYDDEAMYYLMGYSSRLSGSREKLSSKFEAIFDVVLEAKTISAGAKIDKSHVRQAIINREVRDARVKEYSMDLIKDGTLMLSTSGKAVGQINALTVAVTGEYSYGMPSRVSAVTSIGKVGVINIEEVTAMSGPIQQKGVMILEGYMRHIFAQEFPISFTSSITFEQNYGMIEGDSASMAELCAILSSLSQVPISQSIAITGAINQFGEVEAIGGVVEKIEGFFDVCKSRGLKGCQGLIVPKSNEKNIILRSNVVEAIKDGKFHLWSVESVHETMENLTGCDSGHKIFKTTKGSETVYGRAYATLERYSKVLQKNQQ